MKTSTNTRLFWIVAALAAGMFLGAARAQVRDRKISPDITWSDDRDVSRYPVDHTGMTTADTGMGKPSGAWTRQAVCWDCFKDDDWRYPIGKCGITRAGWTECKMDYPKKNVIQLLFCRGTGDPACFATY